MGTAKPYNRAAMTTATAGTGTMTLGSAVSNAFCTFAEAGVANSDVVTYLIEDGTNFEIGRGTYTSSGTTLSRTTVLLSKISGTAGTTKITLSGNATVRIIVAKEDFNEKVDTAGSGLSLSGSTLSIDTNNGGGVGSQRLALLGASIANNATTSGSNVECVNLDGVPTISGASVTSSGTWRNIHGIAVNISKVGLFIRIA